MYNLTETWLHFFWSLYSPQIQQLSLQNLSLVLLYIQFTHWPPWYSRTSHSSFFSLIVQPQLLTQPPDCLNDGMIQLSSTISSVHSLTLSINQIHMRLNVCILVKLSVYLCSKIALASYNIRIPVCYPSSISFSLEMSPNYSQTYFDFWVLRVRFESLFWLQKEGCIWPLLWLFWDIFWGGMFMMKSVHQENFQTFLAALTERFVILTTSDSFFPPWIMLTTRCLSGWL